MIFYGCLDLIGDIINVTCTSIQKCMILLTVIIVNVYRAVI